MIQSRMVMGTKTGGTPLFFFAAVQLSRCGRDRTGKEMRTRRTFPLLIASVIVSACMGSAAFADTLVISGVVTSEGSATVIRSALVTATLGGPSGVVAVDSGRTDALGRYAIVFATFAPKATITVRAQGFQTAQNILNIPIPSIGIPDTIRANFELHPAVVAPSDTVRITGIVADAGTHDPLAGAAIIAQGIAGIGGTAVSDTAWTDSAGLFLLRLPTANQYYPSLEIEKIGYRPLDHDLPSGSHNIQLDTVLIVKLHAGDSVTYVISGAVCDSLGTGIKGAIVQVRISNAALLLYSGKDTTSQLGGYYKLSTRQPYYAGVISIEEHIEKSKYFSKDTLQTIPSSSDGAVINVVLFSTASSVLPRVRVQTGRPAAAAVLFSVDGRRIGRTAAGARRSFASGVLLYKSDGRSAQAVVQLK